MLCTLALRGSSSLWIKSSWMKNSQLAPGCWAAHVLWPPCATSQRKRVTLTKKRKQIKNKTVLQGVEVFVCRMFFCVSRGRTDEVSPIQWREDAELVEEKGTSSSLQCWIRKKQKKKTHGAALSQCPKIIIWIYRTNHLSTCWNRWRGLSLHWRWKTSQWEKASNPRHTSEWRQSPTTMRVNNSLSTQS